MFAKAEKHCGGQNNTEIQPKCKGMRVYNRNEKDRYGYFTFEQIF